MPRADNLHKSVFFLFICLLLSSISSAQSLTDPALRNISIYDVTGSTGEARFTGGELVDYGKNTTLVVNQTENRKDYRFTFRVENNGSADWTLESGDEMFHEDLDTSWSINRTWYNISGTEYVGGSFSSGRVDWNTSEGGTVGSDQNLYAKYIVEIDLPSSQKFDQRFVANDTSENNFTEDEHILDINRLGFLNLTLEEPPNKTVLTENRTFEINTTVNCEEGECGNISITVRYNQSSTADTLIPEGSGEPFHTVNSNRKYCNTKLLSGESCRIQWDVNATGKVGSFHLVDSNASSSYKKVKKNDSEDAEVEIRNVVAINLSWSATNFGLLDPGDSQKAAKGNSNLTYNISLTEKSNQADIWIKGSDLVNEDDSSYSIGISNMSFALENLYSSSERINQSYDLLKNSVSAGSVLNTFYWLDVPTGILEGNYSGSTTFKANLSR